MDVGNSRNSNNSSGNIPVPPPGTGFLGALGSFIKNSGQVRSDPVMGAYPSVTFLRNTLGPLGDLLKISYEGTPANQPSQSSSSRTIGKDGKREKSTSKQNEPPNKPSENQTQQPNPPQDSRTHPIFESSKKQEDSATRASGERHNKGEPLFIQEQQSKESLPYRQEAPDANIQHPQESEVDTLPGLQQDKVLSQLEDRFSGRRKEMTGSTSPASPFTPNRNTIPTATGQQEVEPVPGEDAIQAYERKLEKSTDVVQQLLDRNEKRKAEEAGAGREIPEETTRNQARPQFVPDRGRTREIGSSDERTSSAERALEVADKFESQLREERGEENAQDSVIASDPRTSAEETLERAKNFEIGVTPKSSSNKGSLETAEEGIASIDNNNDQQSIAGDAAALAAGVVTGSAIGESLSEATPGIPTPEISAPGENNSSRRVRQLFGRGATGDYQAPSPSGESYSAPSISWDSNVPKPPAPHRPRPTSNTRRSAIAQASIPPQSATEAEGDGGGGDGFRIGGGSGQRRRPPAPQRYPAPEEGNAGEEGEAENQGSEPSREAQNTQPERNYDDTRDLQERMEPEQQQTVQEQPQPAQEPDRQGGRRRSVRDLQRGVKKKAKGVKKAAKGIKKGIKATNKALKAAWKALRAAKGLGQALKILFTPPVLWVVLIVIVLIILIIIIIFLIASIDAANKSLRDQHLQGRTNAFFEYFGLAGGEGDAWNQTGVGSTVKYFPPEELRNVKQININYGFRLKSQYDYNQAFAGRQAGLKVVDMMVCTTWSLPDNLVPSSGQFLSLRYYGLPKTSKIEDNGRKICWKPVSCEVAPNSCDNIPDFVVIGLKFDYDPQIAESQFPGPPDGIHITFGGTITLGYPDPEDQGKQKTATIEILPPAEKCLNVRNANQIGITECNTRTGGTDTPPPGGGNVVNGVFCPFQVKQGEGLRCTNGFRSQGVGTDVSKVKHEGIDWNVTDNGGQGTNKQIFNYIYAPVSGTIYQLETDEATASQCGWKVVIQADNGDYYYFGHVSKEIASSFKVGQRINQGTAIGNYFLREGNGYFPSTGQLCWAGSHVHMEHWTRRGPGGISKMSPYSEVSLSCKANGAPVVDLDPQYCK